MPEEILDIDVESEEGQKHLVDFFSLLLKIDKRNNPELYEKDD